MDRETLINLFGNRAMDQGPDMDNWAKGQQDIERMPKEYLQGIGKIQYGDLSEMNAYGKTEFYPTGGPADITFNTGKDGISSDTPAHEIMHSYMSYLLQYPEYAKRIPLKRKDLIERHAREMVDVVNSGIDMTNVLPISGGVTEFFLRAFDEMQKGD